MTGVLAPVRPLDRAEIAEIFELLNGIENAVTALPYRSALAAIRDIEAMRATVGDGLPGGYVGSFCEGCSRPIGEADIAAHDPEDGIKICHECQPADAPQSEAIAG